VIGVGIFAIAAVGDMIWHTVLGLAPLLSIVFFAAAIAFFFGFASPFNRSGTAFDGACSPPGWRRRGSRMLG